MILEALLRHYETLVEKGVLSLPGWLASKVSYAVCLDLAGELVGIVDVRAEVKQKRGTKLVPQLMMLPEPPRRVSNVVSCFIWDNAKYALGVSDGDMARTGKCFGCFKSLHHKLLDGLSDPRVVSFLKFLDEWDYEIAGQNDVLQPVLKDLAKGCNVVFRVDGCYLHEISDVRRAWQSYYDRSDGVGSGMSCLVTGTVGDIARVHPAIKGVAGAQSSGASLVSFNSEAFCSYGQEQGLNAPISKYAAFGYTSVLNHMLSDKSHVLRVGDTTVLFWSQDGESGYQDFCLDALNSTTEQYLFKMLNDLCSGNPVTYDGFELDSGMKFYVLGLAPNAGRIFVRFFFEDTFGSLLKNVLDHYDRLKLFDGDKCVPLWRLLKATVNEKSKDKTPSPLLSGQVLQSVLLGTRYPSSLLYSVNLRIRGSQDITHDQAAILKAYYSKNGCNDIPEEVLSVGLNEECNDVAYLLGRLFAMYESIQVKSVTLRSGRAPDTTIRDKWFGSACARPGVVFPTLVALSQNHMHKIQQDRMGAYVNYDKQVIDLLSRIGTSFPTHLSLAQQGSFQLGYFQQRKHNMTKSKEEKQDA